jgi:hypothetical protein
MGWLEGVTTLLLAVAAVPAMKADGTTLWEVLGAPGPETSRAAKMRLYEPLVGSWRVEVVDYAEDGSKRTQVGEWHFAWVLEGRAIQDVFVVPLRSQRKAGEVPGPGNRCGTSIRVYDPRADVWHVTWNNPVTGAFNRLVGRRAGDDIVQEGRDDNGAFIRWSFREITPRSFHWLGEDSKDDGKTWHLAVEFFARRME